MAENVPADISLACYYGFETPEEGNVRIRKALAALEPFGVSLEKFNYHTVILYGLKQFLKLSRTVLSHPDDLRKALIDIGVKRGIYKHPEEMDVSGFVELCTFVKSKEGHKILLEIQQRLKLEKRVKRIHEGYDLQIAELESKIRKLKKNKEAEINEFGRKYQNLDGLMKSSVENKSSK